MVEEAYWAIIGLALLILARMVSERGRWPPLPRYLSMAPERDTHSARGVQTIHLTVSERPSPSGSTSTLPARPPEAYRL